MIDIERIRTSAVFGAVAIASHVTTTRNWSTSTADRIGAIALAGIFHSGVEVAVGLADRSTLINSHVGSSSRDRFAGSQSPIVDTVRVASHRNPAAVSRIRGWLWRATLTVPKDVQPVSSTTQL